MLRYPLITTRTSLLHTSLPGPDLVCIPHAQGSDCGGWVLRMAFSWKLTVSLRTLQSLHKGRLVSSDGRRTLDSSSEGGTEELGGSSFSYSSESTQRSLFHCWGLLSSPVNALTFGKMPGEVWRHLVFSSETWRIRFGSNTEKWALSQLGAQSTCFWF